MEENEKYQAAHDQNEKTMEHLLQIHESKSHPGWKYCYNTQTKSSMWIECDAQADKEKTGKNPVQNQSTFNQTHCPEAKSNSSKDVITASDGSSNMYKKQNIKGPFPNSNCNIPVCQNNQKMYKSVNFVNPSLPVNNSGIPAYSSNVCSVPPNTQFIVTPPVIPLINQPQILLDQSQVLIPVSFNNLPHNLLTPSVYGLTNGFINSIMQEKMQGPNYRKYMVNQRVNRRHNVHRRFYSKRNEDLRNVLSSKGYHKYDDDENEETVGHSEKNYNDVNTHHNHQGIQEYLVTPQQLDLTVIRELATSNVNLDQWYIVVDRTVIQENFNFLNNLIDSDNSCRIMVPESVFNEIRTLSDDQSTANIRRLLRFISDEIACGRRWIGDNFINTEQSLSPLEVCFKLSSENYHVVLVTSDKEFLKLKNKAEIPIFTIEEFKNIVTNSNTSSEPPKTKFFAERIVSVVNNEQKSNTETSSKFECEHSLINRHSCLAKPSEQDIQTNFVKKHCNVNLQNELDTAKVVEETQPVLVAEENGITARVNADESGIVNNTNTPAVKYNRRVIKLKQNEPNQKQCQNTKKGWNSRKRTNVVDTGLTSNASTSTKQNDEKLATSDVLVDLVKCKYNGSSGDLSCSTSEYTNRDINDELYMVSKKKKTNLVIDESSSLMSRNESAFDSENIDRHVPRFKPDVPNVKVMFEIIDKNMEEFLIVRCDEWVSRFVQIMEEVLSQVLQQDPPFISEELPPPWTLQDAAQCVIKKFSHCFYVVDAANNLSIILHKTSDISSKNMKPTDFMKMYSYGVYLIKALIYVSNNNEDLYNANESLKKLLDDIKNHDADCPNDSFNNLLQGSPVADKGSRHCSAEMEESKSTIDEQTNRNSVERHASPASPLHELEAVTFHRNNDLAVSFFSNLELQKSACSSLSNSIDVPAQATVMAAEVVDENESHINKAPKIIRQFNKCVDYEERLKKPKSRSMQWDDGYDYNERFSDDYGEDIETEDNMYRNEEYESENSVDPAEDNIKRFRCFIGLFVQDIREAFTQVHELCKTLVESECTQSKSNQADVYKKAKKAHLYIDKLSRSLESILNREAGNPDKDIQTLMGKAGVHVSLDQSLTSEYKSIISKCMDQAKEYLSYLNIVISLNRSTVDS